MVTGKKIKNTGGKINVIRAIPLKSVDRGGHFGTFLYQNWDFPPPLYQNCDYLPPLPKL